MSESTDLIQQIEQLESARIINYILADRMQGPQAGIATDALSLFYRHLQTIGETEKIALYLYSTGGDTMVPWRLVNLIREYCQNLVVLIPYKAHSAATLLCLGADEIVMSKMAELSPIDPSVANAFNPQPPLQQGAPPQAQVQRIPISVEDVSAYIRLATERAGLDTSEGRLGAFQQLTNVVHPLALGNVERSHTLIRTLAKKLLLLHTDTSSQEGADKVTEIVDTLTEKLYSHQHLIPRKEAKDFIGLKVRYANPELENLLMSLYQAYQTELNLGESVNPSILLQDRTELQVTWPIAKIETTNTEDQFVLSGKIIRAAQPLQPPTVNIIEQGWKVIR